MIFWKQPKHIWVLELFAMYATDRQTDGGTDGQKQRLLPPSLWSGGITSEQSKSYLIFCATCGFLLVVEWIGLRSDVSK